MKITGKAGEATGAEKITKKQHDFIDTKSCDLVVLGGGGGGLVVAVRVAQLSGKKVMTDCRQ